MALSCADIRRLIDEEGSLVTADARQHLATCADCRLAVERWQAVAAKLEEWRDDPTPAFLHSRVMAHVRAASRERAAQRPLLLRLWWAPTLATAALVAIVIWRMPGHPTPVAGPAASAPGAGAAAPTARPAPPSTTLPTRSRPDAPAATPRTAAGPTRGVSESSRAANVPACELIGPDDQTTRRRVSLEATWAPPPGVRWTIEVAPTGLVRPGPAPGDEGAARSAVPLETLEALSELDLPPGRYVLSRAR